MSLAARIAKNTLVQIISKIISTILGLFSIALITRYLGQAGFGEYTTVITFLTFFAVIADLGLTLVTAQMIAGRREPEEERHILNNLFGLRLLSVLFFLALAPLFAIFSPYGATVKAGILLAAAAFIFPALNQIIVGLFQKKLSMNRDAAAEVFSRLVLIAGIIFSEKSGAGLNGVLITTVAAGAANFLLHYFLAFKYAFIRPAFDFGLWKKIVTKSWPLAVTIVLNLIYLRADTLLLSFFKSPADVGLYGAAYRVIDVLATLPFMFAGLVLPILTAAWLDNEHEYFRRALQKSFDFMAALAIPLVIGAQFVGKSLMVFVAGDDFAPSGAILQILIFAVAAIFLGTMFSHAVIALDKQRKMIRFYVFTGLSSLIGYLWLIPRFSVFGAAGVTIYSEVLIAAFAAYCVYKYGRFRPKLKMSGRALAAGLLMGACLYFSPQRFQTNILGLIAVLLIAALVYFGGLWLFGGLGAEDLSLIFKRQKKGASPTYDPTGKF